MLTTFDHFIKLILGFQKVSTNSIKSKMSHQLPVTSNQSTKSVSKITHNFKTDASLHPCCPKKFQTSSDDFS